jgi:rRNA-processing protein FCF1
MSLMVDESENVRKLASVALKRARMVDKVRDGDDCILYWDVND